MTVQSPVLAILSDESERVIAGQLANMLGYDFAHVVVGDGHQAAEYIQQMRISPQYVLFSIGARRDSVEAELSDLAGQCVAGTKVIVSGQTNDIQFYRFLINSGVLDYVNPPLDIAAIARAFSQGGSQLNLSDSKVIAFTSAGAGDGASTVAVNAAYALAKEHGEKTVLVDMDYQFGMIAKNLDLSSPFGLKDLLDHPDRGIDSMLVERMAVPYSEHLDVIAAPNALHFYPSIQPEIIRDLIAALTTKYRYIILDLPHVWSPWISAAFNQSAAVILVAQLWLKSVTHATRQLAAWRAAGVDLNQVSVCINRSGAKFKEGVIPQDFERVCGKQIERYFPNDIRTAALAEQEGKTILQLKKTKLAEEFSLLAERLHNSKASL